MLCYYTNCTSQFQIIRISNISSWFFERVVLPGQQLLFEAPLDARLEVHTSEAMSAILADQISCQRLQVNNVAALGASAALIRHCF